MTTHAPNGRTLRDRIGRHLLDARKRRDDVEVRACRSLLAAIDNAEAVAADPAYDWTAVGVGTNDVPRRELDVVAVRGLFEAELAERQVAADTYRQLGELDAAGELERECEVILGYLEELR